MKNLTIGMLVALLAGCSGMQGMSSSGSGAAGTNAAGSGSGSGGRTAGMIDAPSQNNRDRDVFHPFIN